MKPALNHMMLNQDTLADQFDAILGYRTSHSGLVLASTETAALTTIGGDPITTIGGDPITVN